MKQSLSHTNYSYLIEEFYRRLSDYELEIALTDIYCIDKYIGKNVVCEKFFITPEYRDHGIDSLAVFRDNLNKLYSFQISRGEKRRQNLVPFLNDRNTDKYTDIMNCRHQIYRVVITLKDSPAIAGVDEGIAGQNAQDMIMRVFDHWSMTPVKLEEYIVNIQTRAFHWELINAYRKKRDHHEIVVKYLDIMHCNYLCLLNGSFKLSTSLQFLVDFNSGEVLDYLNLIKSEQIKIKLMVKVKAVSDDTYEKHLVSIDKLIAFILELIDYNLDKYDIVPCCTYVSVKLKRPSVVIAYFAYKYEAPDTSSYHFAFKCDKKSLSTQLQFLQRIADNNSQTISDACSFKTPILLLKPVLEKDSEIIKELFKKSESKVAR